MRCGNGKTRMITSKIFKTFEIEVIPKESNYQWTERRVREPKPSWKDLTDKRVAVPQSLIARVLECREKKHFCIVLGGKDRGKTWLSYAVGYYLVNDGKEVMYASADENFDNEEAWKEIVKLELRAKNQSPVYVILENCNSNCEESEEFFQRILDEGEENLRLLFTMRKIGKLILEDAEPDIFYSEGNKQNSIVPILPDEMSEEHVKNIIRKFVETKGIEYKITEQELEDVTKVWRDDLYWVWLRLNSWNFSEGQNLSNITEDQVIETIWSDRYEIKLSLRSRRDILLPIAAFSQFEPLKIPDSFLRERNIDEDTLKELREEGIIFKSGKEYEFLSIQEGFADIILTCTLQKDNLFKKEYQSKENFTIKNLKDYIIENRECGSLFSTLNSTREGEKANFAKQILISLIDDQHIWEIVMENVKDMTLYQFLSLLNSILWSKEIKKIKGDRYTLELRSCYLKHNYKNLQNKLKSSSATCVSEHVELLGRFINLENFFNNFSILDFECIINKSTINSLRKLFFSFMGLSKAQNHSDTKGMNSEYQTIHSGAQKMARALLNADLVSLISQENSSLYRLSGLIGNVMQVDVSVATSFVEKLSEIDLNELFSKTDLVAEEKGYTKAQVINHFLSKRISFSPNTRTIIVKGIKDEVWHHLIHTASPNDGFWLLWNVYVNDPIKAKRLVQNNTSELLLHKCTEDQNVVFYLPLLGVLHLSDFAIHKIPLIEADTTQIKQILRKFKKEKNITLLILSLVALKAKLSQEVFKDVKLILDEQLINFIQNGPDLQLRELFDNLIKEYCK